jgi:hypothetical protein
VSDRNSDGSIALRWFESPGRTIQLEQLGQLWHTLPKHTDRAWQHLDHPHYLISSLTRTVDWHTAPGIRGLILVPLQASTLVQYPTHTAHINTPHAVHTHTLHRWIPQPGNVFLAHKLDLSLTWDEWCELLEHNDYADSLLYKPQAPLL